MNRSVFISYAHADTPFVVEFAQLLVSLGVPFWRDAKDLAIGANLSKSIYEGIKASSHFCCVLSHTSIRSRWVEEELSFAKVRQLSGEHDLSIVPVLIDHVEIPDYVLAYRCAHLEDRNIALTNPELQMTLRAFGVDLSPGPPLIVTGPLALTLLSHCQSLKSQLFDVEQALIHIGHSWDDYRVARAAAAAAGDAFHEDQAKQSRASAVFVFQRYRELGSTLSATLKDTLQACVDAGLYGEGDDQQRHELWRAFFRAIGDVERIGRELGDGSENLMWFLFREDKMPRLREIVHAADAATTHVTNNLKTWNGLETL